MFYGKVSLRTDASLSKISLIQGKKNSATYSNRYKILSNR